MDYFYFSALNSEMKSTEILNYILLFSSEQYDPGQRTNYQDLGKYKSRKLSSMCHRKVVYWPFIYDPLL